MIESKRVFLTEITDKILFLQSKLKKQHLWASDESYFLPMTSYTPPSFVAVVGVVYVFDCKTQ